MAVSAMSAEGGANGILPHRIERGVALDLQRQEI